MFTFALLVNILEIKVKFSVNNSHDTWLGWYDSVEKESSHYKNNGSEVVLQLVSSQKEGMIRAAWNLWVLLCGFQSRAFPVYIRACEILWVRASVTGSVGGIVDTQPLLWDAKEDVCVGNVLNEYSRLRGIQSYPLTRGRLVSFHMRTNKKIGKSIWLWSCRMWGLSWISVNMADTRSDGP